MRPNAAALRQTFDIVQDGVVVAEYQRRLTWLGADVDEVGEPSERAQQADGPQDVMIAACLADIERIEPPQSAGCELMPPPYAVRSAARRMWVRRFTSVSESKAAPFCSQTGGGSVMDTLVGPVLFGMSAGVDGEWRTFFGIGRIFG